VCPQGVVPQRDALVGRIVFLWKWWRWGVLAEDSGDLRGSPRHRAWTYNLAIAAGRRLMLLDEGRAGEWWKRAVVRQRAV